MLVSFVSSLVDRAREATRDRATHINDRDRSTSGRVVAAAVAVVAAWVAAARACVCVLCAVVFFALLLDRAREATRDRATQSNDCARSASMCVVVSVVVACVVVACVRVDPSPIDRALEATRERATHSTYCDRSTAMCVVAAAVVAVVAACVLAACVCWYFPHISSP